MEAERERGERDAHIVQPQWWPDLVDLKGYTRSTRSTYPNQVEPLKKCISGSDTSRIGSNSFPMPPASVFRTNDLKHFDN